MTPGAVIIPHRGTPRQQQLALWGLTMNRKPWFKFDTAAFLSGTSTMTLEERGAYIGLLAMMYERDGDLDDNDMVVACGLYVNVRTWRRVKKALVAKGKILISEGKITNRRAQAEIEARSKSSSNLVQTEFNHQTKPETFQKTQQILRATKNKKKIKKENTPLPPAGPGADLGQMDLIRDTDLKADFQDEKPSVPGEKQTATERAIGLWDRIAIPAGAAPTGVVTDTIKRRVGKIIGRYGWKAWEQCCVEAAQADWLLRKAPGHDGTYRDRAVDLEWASRDENFTGLVNGKYRPAPVDDSRAGALQRRRNIQNGRGLKYYA